MTGGFSRTWGAWGRNSSHTTRNPFPHVDRILQLRLSRRAKSERANCGREVRAECVTFRDTAFAESLPVYNHYHQVFHQTQ